eukprot:TRINITY_DN5376_c0_g2_i4.p1 TRINITY_DN5376_c0_g2~~TRINITY_DN5376_c0_g2_i4.p1  ORF type:complete len:112 (-),score=15.97 TRINITY_DN5376_c0_g2_i4:208-543(-)
MEDQASFLSDPAFLEQLQLLAQNLNIPLHNDPHVTLNVSHMSFSLLIWVVDHLQRCTIQTHSYCIGECNLRCGSRKRRYKDSFRSSTTSSWFQHARPSSGKSLYNPSFTVH